MFNKHIQLMKLIHQNISDLLVIFSFEKNIKHVKDHFCPFNKNCIAVWVTMCVYIKMGDDCGMIVNETTQNE